MLIISCKSKAHPPLGLCERAMCCLWLHAVLSSGLYGKEGALLVMPSQSVHFNICIFMITSPLDRKYLIGGLNEQLLKKDFGLTMANNNNKYFLIVSRERCFL